MTSKRTTRKPTRRTRLASAAAGTVAFAVLASAALGSLAAVPPATQTEAPATGMPVGPQPPAQGAPPEPSIGKPFLVDVSGGSAKVTIASATLTKPGVLTLDVSWDSLAGPTTPDPAQIRVTDGTGAPARPRPLSRGALPLDPVRPGHPVRGKLAYDIPAAPAALILKPSGAAEATRITVG